MPATSTTRVGPRTVTTVRVSWPGDPPGDWVVAVRALPGSSWHVLGTSTAASASFTPPGTVVARDVRVQWQGTSMLVPVVEVT